MCIHLENTCVGVKEIDFGVPKKNVKKKKSDRKRSVGFCNEINTNFYTLCSLMISNAILVSKNVDVLFFLVVTILLFHLFFFFYK